MTINIIGDSHCLLYNGVTPHWLNGSTAHNIWKNNKNIETIFRNSYGEVWLGFGWVDCQRHIYGLQEDIELPYQFIVEQTVAQYTHYIAYLRNKFTHVITKVMDVPPAGFEDNIYSILHYPTRDIIHQITIYFNSCLKKEASRLCIPYVEIWGEYENPWPEEDFKEDKAHIKNDIATTRLGRWK